MDLQLDEYIDQLRHMTTAQLRFKYQELFGQASHSNHKDYLFRRLAWRLQALALGGLSGARSPLRTTDRPRGRPAPLPTQPFHASSTT
jgi:hypothetical protein